MSVRSSARPPGWNDSAPNERIFMKFDIGISFETCREKKVWLKSDKSNEYLYLSEFFLEWEVFQTEAVVKIKKHILYPIIFPPTVVPLIR
jgi:hypothetical protein